MKKIVVLLMIALICISGCGVITSSEADTNVVASIEEVEVEVVNTTYTKEILHGRYYTDGRIISDADCNPMYDGQEWSYIEDDRKADDVEVYDGIPVYFIVALADDGDIEKSYICTDENGNGLVYDRTVAIMDTLEKEFEDDFNLKREDNKTIYLGDMK